MLHFHCVVVTLSADGPLVLFARLWSEEWRELGKRGILSEYLCGGGL